MSSKLKAGINEVLQNYLSERQNRSNWIGNELTELKIFKNPLKKIIENKFGSKYKIEGSNGMFNPKWSEIPWVKIALKDENITSGSGRGYFLMYLFDAQMNGVYLSLIQGWEYFKNRYDTIDVANDKAEYMSSKVREVESPNLESEYVTKINLNPERDTGRGFEKAHIIGKYYSADDIPDDAELLEDLEEMLKIYDTLAALMINRSFIDFNNEILMNEDDLYAEGNDEETEYQKASNHYNATGDAKNYG